MKQGYLLLETGEILEGTLIGSLHDSVGELVFNTSMTGYQEILTDPSYAGQILIFCYPLIGNYGINEQDDEGIHPYLSGVITGSICEDPSHYLAMKSFSERLKQSGVVGLTGIDTRLLVKLIRKHGTVKGKIVQKLPEVENQFLCDKFWVDMISTKKVISFQKKGPHIVLVDYGFKKSILNALLNENCSVSIVPYHYSYEQIKILNPDGIILSNGPGDPMSLSPWFSDIKTVCENFPTLGICLGHQLIALAFGAKTEKLTYGHRGGNHPIKDLLTGKVYMSSQNHGYVVNDQSINNDVFQVTFRNVNDQTIEGLKHVNFPIQTVQFHPEAHPGPTDTAYIFNDFIQTLLNVGEVQHAITQ